MFGTIHTPNSLAFVDPAVWRRVYPAKPAPMPAPAGPYPTPRKRPQDSAAATVASRRHHQRSKVLSFFLHLPVLAKNLMSNQRLFRNFLLMPLALATQYFQHLVD